MSNDIYQKYALGAVLSEYGDLTFPEIMADLEEGVIPEAVIVYEPFENFPAESLANLLEEQELIFLTFHKELREKGAQ